jgi:hypothetical protein
LSGATNAATIVYTDSASRSYTNSWQSGTLPAYSNSNGAVCAPSGLISWWPGDDNAYDVVGGNNGTLENGATFAPGEVDDAFSLNGNSEYISINNGTAGFPLGNNARTVEAWVETTNSGLEEIFSCEPELFHFRKKLNQNLFDFVPARF